MLESQPDGTLVVRSFLAITAGILVLFAGKTLNQRIKILREYNIPEPVTGGLLFAVAFWLLSAVAGYQVSFELTARDVLLVYFFTAIGINAQLADLRTGGRPLVMLLLCVAAFVVLQDVAGIVAAKALGHPPALGLLAGSVSMLGGHGTAIAWAPAIQSQSGIQSSLEIGVLCATAGLVMASLLGGPVARFLITRHGLSSAADVAPDVSVHYGVASTPIDYASFLRAILAIHLSGIAGILVHQALTRRGVNVPLFLPCLMAGIVLSAVVPRVAPGIRWPSRTPALALIAELSLGVFLAMSLMSMQLWTLAQLAGPIVVLLAVQGALAVLFAALVIFRVLGRSYDAAVISAGFIGFGLGATPTAMANMTAITQRYGASHVAFLAVPLVGAFFLDILNAIVIRGFLARL